MAQFTSAGLTLAYDEFGPGNAAKAMVLVHGFSSNRYENWKRMGWYDAIAGKGISGFALDCRGHGESAKPHEPEKYGRQAMARDVFALMDHAGVASAILVGLSQGGFTTQRAAIAHPDRVRAIVLCDTVKGLRLTLDPSHYITGPHQGGSIDKVMRYVQHVHLRDSTKEKLHVRVGQGEIDYGKLIQQLGKVGYDRALSVLMTPLEGFDHRAEMRKMRLLLESLL